MPELNSPPDKHEEAEQKTSLPAANLDQAVAEVFSLMMGVECLPLEPARAIARDELVVTAVIGLAGSLSGACILRMEQEVALEIAELLAGTEIGSFDDTVKDALGEVCNMLAGAWKGKLPRIAASCLLSVPAVVSGTNYELHMPKPDFRLDRVFRFKNSFFAFGIVCDGL